jgi:selenocysteine lyase/cysteine desulfurase
MWRGSQDRVWPTIGATGWDDPMRGASRFDRLSQRAWPLVLSVGAALDFQEAIGRDRIERRIRLLHARLRQGVSTLPGVKIYTSAHPELSCALLGFGWEHIKNQDLVNTVLKRHGIWIRTVDYDLNAVRVSTHHYNTEQQVDRLVEALQDVLKKGVIPATAADGHVFDDELAG